MDSLNSQFKELHIFQRLKALLSSRWNIDIFPVENRLPEKKGPGKLAFSRDFEETEAASPVVKAFLSSKVFRDRFLHSLSKGRHLNQKFTVPWKQAGLDIFAIPLLAENSLKGFIAATGILKAGGAEKLQSALRYLNFQEEWIQKEALRLKRLSPEEAGYLKNLLSALAEESFSLVLERRRQDWLIKQLKLSRDFSGYGRLVGKSSVMRFLYNILEKIKNYDSSILIEGESGAGKELLARTIHSQSSRAGKPFLTQNCAPFGGSLLAAEAFGYERPAGEGAPAEKKAGLFEAAHQGTVFFDEIGSAPVEFQTKLLDFLQTGFFSPAGSSERKKADVQIIAATDRDLKKMADARLFSKELLNSLGIITLNMPPLRSRAEDIPLLASHFLQQKDILRERQFSSEALELLCGYSWPGNIRELESEIERILSFLNDSQTVIAAGCLSRKIRDPSFAPFTQSVKVEEKNLKKTLRSVERQILLDHLKKTNWNKTRVAKMLGSSRTSIILKTKEYGIHQREPSDT